MNLTLPARSRFRVLLTVGVFVGASLITAVVLHSRPPTYEATGTVFLSKLYPTPSVDTDLTFEAQQFAAAIALPDPLDQASKETGEAVSALKSITATQEGQGAVVQLQFSGEGAGHVSEILRSITRAGAQFLAEQDANSADVASREANQALSAASAALSAFNAANSYVDLNAANASALSAVQAAQAAQPLNPAAVSQAQALAAQSQAKLNQQSALSTAVSQASSSLSTAQQAVSAAQTEQTAAKGTDLLLINSIDPASRLSLIGKGVVGAALIVLLLAFLGFGFVDNRERILGRRSQVLPSGISRIRRAEPAEASPRSARRRKVAHPTDARAREDQAVRHRVG